MIINAGSFFFLKICSEIFERNLKYKKDFIITDLSQTSFWFYKDLLVEISHDENWPKLFTGWNIFVFVKELFNTMMFSIHKAISMS